MKHDLAETVVIVQQSIYVDDLLCGAANEEKATKIYEEANFIFEKVFVHLDKQGPCRMSVRANDKPIEGAWSCVKTGWRS